MIRIAIFADIHGKILLPFKLTDYYQKMSHKKVDAIFQCGDLGAFPKLENLDKATLRHQKYDRNELGFHDDFVQENKEIKNFLQQLDLDMICVRGNHEDHEYLDELENASDAPLFPIDIYNRVWICKSGYLQTFCKGEECLTFTGIGRIGDLKNRKDKRFVQEYEKRQINKLIKKHSYLDLLISHDKDDSSQRGYGMPELRKITDSICIPYHFYGHTGEDFNQQVSPNGITNHIKIKELEFDSSGSLPYGCMIILEKEMDHLNLEIVDQKIILPFTKEHWKYL
ncbi:metallophosphoesterase [Apibacter raozihei]|uniref:metallophosphoesterase n=1 Tax=Apibacter raozihei TaxID=2500547 RepID=UPI001E2DAC74|nr:metallophosphoesterase [Apibacter raozihei]